MHPNCRSTTVAHFGEEVTANLRRRARDPETGKTELVPGDMTYRQWQKGLQKEKESGIINTGAISGALNPKSKAAEKHAAQYYESVRHMKTDTKKIAANTGVSKEKIDKIKQHVFISEHDLIDGRKRFDPSYEMAQSWQRLINGDFREEDILLLKHEYAELRYMEKGLTQDQAHIKASRKYNYAAFVLERRA